MARQLTRAEAELAELRLERVLEVVSWLADDELVEVEPLGFDPELLTVVELRDLVRRGRERLGRTGRL